MGTVLKPGRVVSHTGLVGKLAVCLSTPRTDGTVRVGWIGLGNELNVGSVFTRGCTASSDQSLGPVILARYNATLYGRQS
jgi:hypothetical protein